MGIDKVYHAIVGFIFGISVPFISWLTEITIRESCIISLILLNVIGLAKEICDSDKQGGKFSHWDLVANTVGYLLGILVLIILDINIWDLM